MWLQTIAEPSENPRHFTLPVADKRTRVNMLADELLVHQTTFGANQSFQAPRTVFLVPAFLLHQRAPILGKLQEFTHLK